MAEGSSQRHVHAAAAKGHRALLDRRRRVGQRALELLVGSLLRVLRAAESLYGHFLLLLHVRDELVCVLPPVLLAQHPLLRLLLQALLVQHALLHLHLLHLRVPLLNHPVELPGPSDVLGVLAAHVILDQCALLAQHRRVALALCQCRFTNCLPRITSFKFLLEQPFARTLLLLIHVLRYHLFAQVVLLVARLELDNLVCSPPGLLDLLESLALLLPQPLQPVAQELHVML
mmetsp:Transcript_16545/g.33426  ORF Transcript_16545/g.33426 Transcript_16545/m.33426 type:complete len:231 (-) Transcript_16545:131-823(-)